MNAPNKLYLPEDFMHAFMLDKPNPKRECIEYIRKDALLEWAKEEMLSHKRKASKIAANSLSNPLLDTHYASEEAYRMLIDKLNSM